ncbi:hypothetical protein AB1Y20_002261 [Prymnesium parvum]|uniref:mRNA guanylyltransferase n=1 Tax=Prymnesium parvum TaxID=97485 RepID=A0AB34JAK9_PRYPA
MAPSDDPLMLPQLPNVGATELKELQRSVLLMLQQEGDKFPGSQPVSFERKHLAKGADVRGVSLFSKSFYAAEKTDGVRYMLLILKDATYAIDRNFAMKKLPPMHFPSREADCKVDRTLLDGELIVDDAEDGGLRHRFLAYDACCVNGRNLVPEPLPIRLLHLRREVLAPRYAAAADGHDFSAEPFVVEQKDFFSMGQLPNIFSQVAAGSHGSKWLYAFNDPLRKLVHGNDGIIFTPVIDPYIPGTCQTLLKWKPANMNSIDFKLCSEWRTESGYPSPRFKIHVADRSSLMEYDWITLNDEDYRRFSRDPGADTRIIECVYDPEWVTKEYADGPTWDVYRERKGGWKFERIREDKKLPNDIRTVESIKQSVADGVSGQELLETLNLKPINTRSSGLLEIAPSGAAAEAPPPVQETNAPAALSLGKAELSIGKPIPSAAPDQPRINDEDGDEDLDGGSI